jgi:hypothetical protein
MDEKRGSRHRQAAMIRHVAYGKAVLGGIAGAAVWEVLAHSLILFGVPFFSIVDTPGAVALPSGSALAARLVGMLPHLTYFMRRQLSNPIEMSPLSPFQILISRPGVRERVANDGDCDKPPGDRPGGRA